MTKSVWTERDLQQYRENVCNQDIGSSCEDCLKTKEEIIDCYFDLCYDRDDEEDI